MRDILFCTGLNICCYCCFNIITIIKAGHFCDVNVALLSGLSNPSSLLTKKWTILDKFDNIKLTDLKVQNK